MERRRLGTNGPTVGAIGLGCMGMSDVYTPTADRSESLRTVRAALDGDVTLFDTGDFYGMGANEMLLGEALKGIARERFQVSVKFGPLRDPGGARLGYDARPEAVKTFLAYSLRRLGLDHIDLYRSARLDPNVPVEDTVGAIADMVKAGYVRHIGLSEVGAETLRRAASVHPIADLQIEYSLFSRGIEDKVLPTARALGIGVTAYGVLSRGLLGGSFRPGAIGADDFRAHGPRFQTGNVEKNLALADALRTIAEARGATVAQVAIAWVLAQGPDIVALVGARRADRLTESLGACDLALTKADLAAIERAVPKGAAAGSRYPARVMAELDSER